jgi:hypothetical protein
LVLMRGSSGTRGCSVNWNQAHSSCGLTLMQGLVIHYVIWGALCPHTAPMEISIHKGVNFEIHHLLCVPQLSIYMSSFTYVINFLVAFALKIIYLWRRYALEEKNKVYFIVISHLFIIYYIWY